MHERSYQSLIFFFECVFCGWCVGPAGLKKRRRILLRNPNYITRQIFSSFGHSTFTLSKAMLDLAPNTPAVWLLSLSMWWCLINWQCVCLSVWLRSNRHYRGPESSFRFIHIIQIPTSTWTAGLGLWGPISLVAHIQACCTFAWQRPKSSH